QHPAIGYGLAQRRRGVQPGHARHLDIEQRDVGFRLDRRRNNRVAGADLGDDFNVGLEAEQERERAAHHALILGKQYAYHALSRTATTMEPSAGFGCAGVLGGSTGAAAARSLCWASPSTA